jgi:hypothetical protein
MMTRHDRNRQFSGEESERVAVGLRHAHPIKRILDRKSRNIVGWLYEWNTGQIAPMWKDKPCEDVIYD